MAPIVIPGTACFSYYQDIITAFAILFVPSCPDLIDCFYELIVLMCIFYSSKKVPPGAFGIGLGESVMVIAKP